MCTPTPDALNGKSDRSIKITGWRCYGIRSVTMVIWQKDSFVSCIWADSTLLIFCNEQCTNKLMLTKQITKYVCRWAFVTAAASKLAVP